MSRQWLGGCRRGDARADAAACDMLDACPRPPTRCRRRAPTPDALARRVQLASRGAPGALRVLAERARRLHAASGRRVVIGITGSPVAGKTTLARLARRRAQRRCGRRRRRGRGCRTERLRGRGRSGRRAPPDGRLPPRERDARPARPARPEGRDRDVRRLGLPRPARARAAGARSRRVRAGIRAPGRRAGRRRDRDRGIRPVRGRRGQLPPGRRGAVAAGARPGRRGVVLRDRRRRADLAARASAHRVRPLARGGPSVGDRGRRRECTWASNRHGTGRTSSCRA